MENVILYNIIKNIITAVMCCWQMYALSAGVENVSQMYKKNLTRPNVVIQVIFSILSSFSKEISPTYPRLQ